MKSSFERTCYNLQVVFVTHASHVCSQHSFGLPLTMNGMHKTQFDLNLILNLNLILCKSPTWDVCGQRTVSGRRLLSAVIKTY